jgi:ribose transport system permease protein
MSNPTMTTVPPPAPTGEPPIWKRITTHSLWRNSGLILALAVLVIIFTVMYPAFFSMQNALNILLAASTIAILAMGQAFVVATSGIDLSIGSTAAVSGIAGALAMQAGIPVLLAIILAIVIGAIGGLINGLIIVYARITPFMVTLGTMNVYAGVALVLSNGRPLYNLPEEYSNFFSGSLFTIPVPVLIMAGIAVVLAFVLRNSTVGEYALSIGGNEEATRLAGININAYKLGVYALSGLAAGIAGVIIAGRLATADPTTGSDLLLPAIAAAVMGGASLLGGETSVVGAVVGAIVITVLQTGLTLVGVSTFYQIIAVGAVIIVAVGADQYTKRRNAAH